MVLKILNIQYDCIRMFVLQGDSGGPLVYQNKDGKKVQVGIVSFGQPCARGAPDAYGKISYLYDWIKEHTK